MQSTKNPRYLTEETVLETSAVPKQEEKNLRTYFSHTKIHETTGQIHMDQSKLSLITYIRGNKYIMILYKFDGNEILSWELQNRTKEATLASYKEMHKLLVQQGLCPK